MKFLLFIWLLFIVSLLTSFTFAHSEWANGSAVPAWVKSQCCGVSDVHHLTPNQVHEVQGGFRVDGCSALFPYAATLPSQDQEYWAFYGVIGNTCYPRCFFAPMNL